jgi:hypothetical protein
MSRINTLGGFSGYASITASSKDEPEYIGQTVAFAQSTAPVGWVKQTTHNDYAIRIVNDIATTGGTVNFSSAFSNKLPFNPISGTWPLNVGTTTITTATMATHTHPSSGPGGTASGLRGGTPAPGPYYNSSYASSGGITAQTLTSTGAGGGHSHTAAVTGVSITASPINIAIKYLDVLLAKY